MIVRPSRTAVPVGPSPVGDVVPADVDVVEVAVLEAGPRHRLDRARLVVAAVADPGEPKAALGDRRPADGFLQRQLLVGPHQRLVGRAERSLDAIDPLQPRVGTTLLRG